MQERGSTPTSYETFVSRIGRLGVQPNLAHDRRDPDGLTSGINVTSIVDGQLTVRPGLVLHAGPGAFTPGVHSLARLDYTVSAFTRFWGANTRLYRGQGGSGTPVVPIDSGYSGRPLTFLPYRPAQSGQTWIITADTAKMRQISGTGVPIPLGLPAPTTLVGSAATAINPRTRSIAAFDGSDATNAAAWVYTAGVDRSDTPVPSGVPVGTDVEGAVSVTTTPGEAAEGYSSLIGRVLTRNLSIFDDAHEVVSDDLIHLRIRLSDPHLIEGVKIYFVCSSGFNPGVIPGTHATANTDAFVKEFRPHDFTGFLENVFNALVAGRQRRQNQLVDEFLEEQLGPPEQNTTPPLFEGSFVSGQIQAVPSSTGGTTQAATQPSLETSPGRHAWTTFGVLGKPLRRGQFFRIGTINGRGWDTITGIVIVINTAFPDPVTVTFDDWRLLGGYNLDSSEPDAQPYDWRFTHYHTVTGDESNPSPEMPPPIRFNPLRQAVILQALAFGDAAVRQRFYRRGGSVNDNWHFLGESSADGAAFTDNVSDDAAAAAPVLELDNDQPVTSTQDNGSTLKAQPLPVVFGPLDGIIFGLGDPANPGTIYWSKPDRPGSWPPANQRDVCAPAEELLAGTALGASGVGFIWSRKRGYTVVPNPQDGVVTIQSSACQVGIASRWAWCVTPYGLCFVSDNEAEPGVYLTNGGEATKLTGDLDPVFRNQAGQSDLVALIGWNHRQYLRLAYHHHRLHLFYRNPSGLWRVIVGEFRGLTQPIAWRQWVYPQNISLGLSEAPPDGPHILFLGDADTENAYRAEGGLDLGFPIGFTLDTPNWDVGRPREQKVWGDATLDVLLQLGVVLAITPWYDDILQSPVVLDPIVPIKRQRYVFDPFGTSGIDLPAKTHVLSLRIAGTTSPTGLAPILYQGSVSYILLPDETKLRATHWESFPTEQYLTGVAMTIDTQGAEVTFQVEGTVADATGDRTIVAASVPVTTSGRRVRHFSWPAVRVTQVRIRPTANSTGWLLYEYTWDKTVEPPRTTRWDSGEEDLGDTWYTGLDLTVDTSVFVDPDYSVATKQIEVLVDGQVLVDPVTGLPYWEVSGLFKRVVHLTLPPGRGHVYQFRSIDDNLGIVYRHTWITEPEPGEQWHWNQNYSVGGTLTDKLIKGVLIEADTFDALKTVDVEIDGVFHHAFQIRHHGRKVGHVSWPSVLGRVVRLVPVDPAPTRRYSLQWIFDEEPLALTRWEIPLTDHQLGHQHWLLSGQICLRSTAEVTLVIRAYRQNGELAGTMTRVLASTGGLKVKRHFQADALLGWLYDYTFTSPVGCALYREESHVVVGGPGLALEPRQPFGNDGLTVPRAMGRAESRAATPAR